MRRIGKILGILVLILVVGIAALIGFLAVKKPAMRPPSTEKVEATPERLARGQYLVENVTHCLGCHSAKYSLREPTSRTAEYNRGPRGVRAAARADNSPQPFLKCGARGAPAATPTMGRGW